MKQKWASAFRFWSGFLPAMLVGLGVLVVESRFMYYYSGNVMAAACAGFTSMQAHRV